MELAILIAYYLIIKSVGTTVGNVAALVQGRPVRVSRVVPAAGGGTRQVVGPSYAGRAVGTVAAVAKESVSAGVVSGWATGKAKYAARVEKRAAKKAAKAGQVPDGAPVLDTSAPRDGVEDTGGAPKAGEAPHDGHRSLGELLDDNKPVAPDDPRPRWLFGEKECRVVLPGGARCGRVPHPESYLRMCAEHDAEDLARECPLTYATSWQTRERLLAAGRCWHEKEPGRGYCGRKAAAASATGLCAAHDPTVTGGVPVMDAFAPELDRCGTCDLSRVEHCRVCQACLSRSGGRHVPDCPAGDSGGNERSDHGDQGEQRAVLYLVRDQAGGPVGGSGGEGAAGGVLAGPVVVPGQSVQVPVSDGGVMSTTTSGETTTISSARAFLVEMAGHLDGDVATQVRTCHATLAGQGMDPDTLGRISSALEHLAAAAAALRDALDTHDAQHSRVEEAVKSTPHVAETDYYRD